MEKNKLFISLIFPIEIVWAKQPNVAEINISIDNISGCVGNEVKITISPNGEVPPGTLYKYFYNSGTSVNIKINTPNLMFPYTPTSSGFFYVEAYKDGSKIATSENENYTVIPNPAINITGSSSINACLSNGKADFEFDVNESINTSLYDYNLELFNGGTDGGTLQKLGDKKFKYTVNKGTENVEYKLVIKTKTFPVCSGSSGKLTVAFKDGGPALKEKPGPINYYVSDLNEYDLTSIFTNYNSSYTVTFTGPPGDFSKAIIKQYQNSINKVDDITYKDFQMDEIGVVDKVSYKFVSNGMYAAYYSFFHNGKALTLHYTFMDSKTAKAPDENIKQLELYCP